MKRGYEYIDGGFPRNALVDFTGGVSESIDLRTNPDPSTLWEMLLTMNARGTLMAAWTMVIMARLHSRDVWGC